MCMAATAGSMSPLPPVVPPEAAPPAGALPDALVRWIVDVAIRAPSVHNTQPWRFTCDGKRLELWADLERRLHVLDPDGRQLRLSCGAALFHARLAVERLGRTPAVRLLPRRDRPELLATVDFGVAAPAPRRGGTGAQERRSGVDRRLLDAVPHRHTQRRPFAGGRLSVGEVATLAVAAEREDTRLHRVEWTVERDELGRLAALANSLEEADPAYRDELATWTGRDESSRDGIPPEAVPPAPDVPDVAQRAFDLGSSDTEPERDRPVGRVDPDLDLLILWTEQDAPVDQLRAGQALARVLLTATLSGIRGSLLEQPLEVPELLTALRRRTGISGVLQAVLRLGHGPEAAPTPRRPVEDVLTILR